MDKLTVLAQGSHITSDDRLFLVLDVRDEMGDPVVGLGEKSFKVWQMGHFFGALGSINAIDIGASLPELAGVYHLVRSKWAPAVDGTFAFRVRVSDRKTGFGSTLAWVVKTG